MALDKKAAIGKTKIEEKIEFSRSNVKGNTPEERAKAYHNPTTDRVIYTLPKSQKKVEIDAREAIIDNGIVTGVTLAAANKLVEVIEQDEIPASAVAKNDNRADQNNIVFNRAEPAINPEGKIPFKRDPKQAMELGDGVGYMSPREIALAKKNARNSNKRRIDLSA